MGGLFQQRPWTPTKRRGPIAAEYNSPGPACVTLPSYIGKRPSDSRSGRAPAFSFGAKHNGKLDSAGPGPGQYNITGLSSKGKDNPPAASLHSRPKEARSDNFPAPGDYDPDKAGNAVHDSAPKFTFGLKTNKEKPQDTPAPNVYNIPEKHETPRYSFGIRTQAEKPLDTPAPNKYNLREPNMSPKFTFGVRTKVQTTSNTPAPNVYNLSETDNSCPKYSFGQKVQTEKPTDTPGPNVYNIPTALGSLKEGTRKSAPSYTISGRNKEPLDDRVRNPGPGSYNNVNPENYKQHSPAFTMSARTNVPCDSTRVPGPGVYSPEKVNFDLQPAHSFGIKHSPYAEHY